MSNRQGNCMSEASAILPIANAITPKQQEYPCDSTLTQVVPIATALLNSKKMKVIAPLVYRGKCNCY